ncbi:MAG: hypothetical protein QM328_02755 [Acidobacteriota bacterium]|nr:hypothetical protein [Acidobacteriota bacterium]
MCRNALLALAAVGVAFADVAAGQPAADIDTRRELFVDSFLVESLEGDVTRQLHHPIPREIVHEYTAPWEGPTSAYMTILRDGDLVRLYLRGSGHEGGGEVTCMAESTDGIHFTRPELGLFEFDGSTANSIVWLGEGTHNFTPFVDTNPDCQPEERYKAIAGRPPLALASPDGIHWRKLAEDPVITEGAFDSQNLAFYDTERGYYVCFLRDFADGVRTIRTCTSPDFVHWTEPEWLDYGDAPLEHLYTNAAVPYFRAPHIYLAFPNRYVPERTKIPEHGERGVCDGVLMSSRDGVHWERWEEAFLRPGPDPLNWTDRNQHIAYGILPLSETELSIYWTENYRHDTARLRRGTLRTDGFVSLHGGAEGGTALTRPLIVGGSRLEVNYATSAVGSIRFEVLGSEEGAPLAISEELFGDEITRVVEWVEGAELSLPEEGPIRLRIHLRDADLYSLRFLE